MDTANKLTIELVDTGTKGGQPPNVPGSSSGTSQPPSPAAASEPVSRGHDDTKLDELLSAMAAAMETVRPVAGPIEKLGTWVDPATGFRTSETDFAPEPIDPASGLPIRARQSKEDFEEEWFGATQGPQRSAAGVPVAKSMTAAEVSEIQMTKATAEYARKVKDKLLAYDEAIAELTKLVKSRGLGLTELLRGRGLPTTQTAADYYQGQFRDAIKAAGMPVPAAWTEPLKSSDLRPVAMPKPFRPVGEVVSTPESREAEAAALAERKSNLVLSGIATQNVLSGRPGQTAAGAVQFAGTGALGPQAKAFAEGVGGAAVQLAGILVDLADNTIRSGGAAIRGGMQTAGDMAKDVARTDGLSAFIRGVDGAADALERIPLAGTALGEAFKATTTALRVANDTIAAFADRGRELRMYDAGIAQAAALVEVKKIQMDIAEANRFSAQYVKMIEAEARVHAAWRRATDPIRARIMEFLANYLAPWLERVGGRVEQLMQTADMVGVLLDNVDKLANFDFRGVADALDRKMKDIADELKKRKLPGEAGAQAVDSWMAAVMKLELSPVPAPEVRDRELKLPLFLEMGGGG